LAAQDNDMPLSQICESEACQKVQNQQISKGRSRAQAISHPIARLCLLN
jgi:hypothetical protein